MASDLCVSTGVEAPGRVGPRDGAASVNVIHVAKLLTRTEERLLDTERGLIEAVRRTIHVTEGMIALVRSTTATTHALMLPHGDGGYLGACRGPGECTQASLHCACQRVAMAKDLVRVVEGLNRTAGRVNEATDCLIKLSNRLSPREPLTETCTDYLMERVVAAEGAARSITQVQSSLQLRVHTLGVAAEALCSRGLGPGVEATPERDRAVQDLRSMMDSASTAVAELTATADTLQDSAQFLRGVVRELIALQVTQACPAAGAVLLEQLECPVCYQASAQASEAMWTCVNGHVVCASCRLGVLTCPVCRGPLATRPAMLLAAWASGLRARCPWGCASLLGLQDRAKHHEACERRRDLESRAAEPAEGWEETQHKADEKVAPPVSDTPEMLSQALPEADTDVLPEALPVAELLPDALPESGSLFAVPTTNVQAILPVPAPPIDHHVVEPADERPPERVQPRQPRSAGRPVVRTRRKAFPCRIM